MNSLAIRKAFLDYFHHRQHHIAKSSTLIPALDASLLFTNAGMVPFKEVFLDNKTLPYTKIASCQRCLRAGGKHNDLENVGYTARHHTFFEMLGNFSFGDYFKKQAIEYAWEFLTTVLKLPEEKLWVSVFRDDKESQDIWLHHIGIDQKRLSRCGEEDNFWQMADSGPCGPCSEIFYDHGANIAGGPPGHPDQNGNRYVEIWNLVFMQYHRDSNGQLHPLAQQSVDTGMGLERLAAILQGVHNNYESDLFAPIIAYIAKLTSVSDKTNPSLQVMADHIRSSAFLITDGIRPSNEGRGYVLRRIIRRAMRHGYQLGLQPPFFYRLVAPFINTMGDVYRQLVEKESTIVDVITTEEQQFAKTIDQGMRLLQQNLKTLPNNIIPGELAFKLYDTYGFPIDITADIAREHGLTIDQTALVKCMKAQRHRSQTSSQFKSKTLQPLPKTAKTLFLGYQQLSAKATIIHLLQNNRCVEQLSAGQQGIVVVDQTPFYPESGGQVGDVGLLSHGDDNFEVQDTQKQGNAILHIGKVLAGRLHIHTTITANVNSAKRQATALNHSATHLLHTALRVVLGKHVRQKGSLVAPCYLRFDFSHDQPLTTQQLITIERLINQQIRANYLTSTKEMPLRQAQSQGILALFDEKYSDKVRVVMLGEFSKELCGGTHVNRSGDIGLFKITHETNAAAGIRRIEALTGESALLWLEQQQRQYIVTAKSWQDKLKQRDREIEQLQTILYQKMSDELLRQAKKIVDINVLIATIAPVDAKILRNMIDYLKGKLDKSIIVLLSPLNKKVAIMAGIDARLTHKIQANQLVKSVVDKRGGKGGGHPELAQGGMPSKNLSDIIEAIDLWIKAYL